MKFIFYSFQRDIEKQCPEVLKWGILQNDVRETGDSDDVSFLHPILQQFAAAAYITKEVKGAQDKQVRIIKIHGVCPLFPAVWYNELKQDMIK